jgi:hypothetical protein
MATDAQLKSPAAPTPKRRWFQYGISTLLLLILVCGAVLALVVNPARRQRRAVEFVRDLGGHADHANEGDMQSTFVPGWLQRSLGDDYFRSVDAVDLHDTPISNSGMAHLKGLTALEWLHLDTTAITDEGLLHLEGMKALRNLTLSDTRIGDEGMRHLRGLEALNKL